MNSPNSVHSRHGIRSALLAALLVLLGAAPGGAYTLIRVQDFVVPPAHWPVSALPLPMLISQAGSDNVPDSSDTAAIIAAQQTWNRISTDYFAFGGPAVGAGTALNENDGKNSIFFDETGAVFGAGSTAIAFTVLNIDASTGVISDADLVFNGTLTFSTATPTPALAFDIQGIATHELGHVTGLDHAGIVSAVMFPVGADGQQFQRELAPDDRLGDSFVYPESAGGTGIAGLQAGDGDLGLTTGSLSGAVRTSGGIPVPGAHVVALDPNGAAVVSDISRMDGSYLLPGLFPGNYQVYAEPLDGVTVEQDLAESDFMNAYYPFNTTFAGGNASPSTVAVAAGAEASGNDILPGSLYGVETEANNTFGAANPVALAALTSGVSNPAGDVDYFSFPGTNLDFISIDVDASGDGLPFDPYLTLYSTNGTTVLATNDDFLGKGTDSRIIRRLAATGTFYLRVEDFSNVPPSTTPIGGPGSFYTVHVNKAVPEVESNNSSAAANQAAIGEYRGGVVSTSGDADYYKFTFGFGDRILADVSARRAGSPLNPALTLYGANGTTILASNNDIDNAGGNLDSFIDYTCTDACFTAPITAYLKVTAQAGSGSGAFYVLHIGTDFLNPVYSAVNGLGKGLGGTWTADIFPKFISPGSSFDLIVAGTGIPEDPAQFLSVSGPGVSLLTSAGPDYGVNPIGVDFLAMTASVAPSAPPGPRTVFIQNAVQKAALSGVFVIRPTGVPPEIAPSPPGIVWSGPQVAWPGDPSATSYSVYRGSLPLADLDLNGVADSYGSSFACGVTVPLAADPEIPAPGGGFFYLVAGRNAQGEGALGFTRNNAGTGPARPRLALAASCP